MTSVNQTKAQRRRRVLSGPTTDSEAMIAHMVAEHNWTEPELLAMVARHGATASRVHRCEHELNPKFWEHEHG